MTNIRNEGTNNLATSTGACWEDEKTRAKHLTAASTPASESVGDIALKPVFSKLEYQIHYKGSLISGVITNQTYSGKFEFEPGEHQEHLSSEKLRAIVNKLDELNVWTDGE